MAGIKEAVALDMMGDKISQGVTVMKHSTVQQTLIDLIERLLMNLEELKDEKAQDEDFFLFCEKPICAKAEGPSVQEADLIEMQLKKLKERKHEQAQDEDLFLCGEKATCAKAERQPVQQTDLIEMLLKNLEEQRDEKVRQEEVEG